MSLKKTAHYVLLFFLAHSLPLYAASEMQKSADAIYSKSAWPTEKEQEIIQKAINSYPLKQQLATRQRYYNINNDGLLFNKQTINESRTYSQTTFNNAVKFFLTQFNKPMYFVLSTFNKEVIFSNTTSEAFINFEQAIFTSKVDLTYCLFNTIVNFYGAVFQKSATFYRTKFYDINFTDVAFLGPANFSQVKITSRSYFVDANFDDKVSFNETNFGHTTDFTHTIFKRSVDFSNAKFGQTAVFSRSEFYGEVNFDNTYMPDYLDFSYIQKINTPINMNAIQNQFNRIRQINLVGTNIKKLILDYSLYKLHFPPDTSDSLIMGVYQNLIYVQKQLGFTEGFKKISIEFKTYQYTKNAQYIRYFFDKYMWNFGFDISNLLTIVLLVILFFTLINGFFYRRLVHSTYKVPFLDIYSHNQTIEKNAFFRYFFYLPLAFFYTILVLLGGIFAAIKIKDIRRQHVLLSIYFVVMVICGFLCTFIMLKYVFSL